MPSKFREFASKIFPSLSLILTVALIPQYSLAYEIRFENSPLDCPFTEKSHAAIAVFVSGEITSGFSEELESTIIRGIENLPTLNADREVPYVICRVDIFEVPGGDVYEAMAAARIIRRYGLETQVTYRENYCLSACVLMFAGGVLRVAFDEKIGIHSFYAPEFLGSGNVEEIEKNYSIVHADISNFLREMRVPVQILDRMTSVSHRRIVYLDMDEMFEMGLVGFDPVYDQAYRQ